MPELVGAFWQDSTPFVRRMIIQEAEAKQQGVTRWEFNVFGLTLDFDAATATVDDLLSSDEEAETVPLAAFVDAAAAFGDSASEGDGLTAAERHPPTFEASADGEVIRRFPV